MLASFWLPLLVFFCARVGSRAEAITPWEQLRERSGVAETPVLIPKQKKRAAELNSAGGAQDENRDGMCRLAKGVVCTPFDRLWVRIHSPDSNQDHQGIDSIRVQVAGQPRDYFTLKETDLNSGVFERHIRLSPNLDKFPGDVETRRGEGVSVTFRLDSDWVFVESVFIDYNVGQAGFDRDVYFLKDRAWMLVWDPDMNRNPQVNDTIQVRVWSDTDKGGIRVTLRETGAATGLFRESLTFTWNESSTGTRLRVAPGGAVILKYEDRTLPYPARLRSDGIETLDVEEVLVSAEFR